MATLPTEVTHCSSNSSMDIILFAEADWDHVLWTNRQHVAYRLPRLISGARVLYVAAPRFALSGSVGRTDRLMKRRFPEGEYQDGRWTTRIGERLWVLQPRLPVPNRLLRRRVPWLLDMYTFASVRQTMRRLGFNSPVVWSYTPLFAPLIGRLGERLLCYDVVDEYTTLPEYKALGSSLVEQDRLMTERAHLVVYSSEKVYQERKRLNPNSHFVGNAADTELFAKTQSESLARPADLAGIREPIISFHGAVTSYKLDTQLIRDLSSRRPDWSFVFLGLIEDAETRAALRGLPNVHLLGIKEQSQLPAYLAHAAVCIIPYKRTPYTERLNALKLYECLAAGKPVVATNLPCFHDYERVVYLRDGVESFVDGIELALNETNGSLEHERMELARTQSWDLKIARIVQLIGARGELAKVG